MCHLETIKKLLLTITCVLVGALNVFSADVPVDFSSEVYPILQRSCLECHGEKLQAGGLRLDMRTEALQSGSLEPGKPGDSELLRRVELPAGHDDLMPAVGEPLSVRQVALLRRWIEEGAHWPEDFEPGPHWAYVAPQRASLPVVQNKQWCASPLDYFVLRRLEDEGISPSPPAVPEKLLRRVFLDLIGLPPTPAELRVYAANPTPERFEEFVEELLERPQFGERWARPWLDLARYADSHGFQRDDLREIWAYRDWVIQALNADMPFDQFTIEQIAGDLLPNASESQKIATGFNRCTPINVEAGSLPEATRIAQVIDRVNTTGAVWLGTTLECCQCHDHKYDPFTLTAYYQMLAFYNNTIAEAGRADPKKPSSIRFEGPVLSLSDPLRDERRQSVQSQLANFQNDRQGLRDELDETLPAWVESVSKNSGGSSRVHRLEFVHFESEGTTDSYRVEEDGAILLLGEDPPSTDVYKVRMCGQLEKIRVFQLDVLRHDELPGKGPGRGDVRRTNFVLNDFSVRLIPKLSHKSLPGQPQVLQFASARASFSQSKFEVAQAIDQNLKSGWAISPQLDRSHWARFVLKEPLDLSLDCELEFTLTQAWGQARAIGCFRLTALTGAPDAEATPVELLEIAAQSATAWSTQDRKKLLKFRLEQDEQYIQLERQCQDLEQQLQELAPDTCLVMVELEEPRAAHVFLRGDYQQLGDKVTAGTPAVLHALPAGPPSRLTLARWLVAPENPLVARVTVNRWWAELFGQGIVSTVEDFGIKGEPASHPELLDWLAVEFVQSGWSMKHVLKTIVLSATYQQASRIDPYTHELDPTNQLLGRGPRFRMDAEMIRDNALAISGLLSLKQFGPPVRPYQPAGIWTKVGGEKYDYQVSPGSEQYRRGIYVVLKRGAPYPSFVSFDASARMACVVKRSRTNTPLQALTLLNDPVYVDAARALGERVQYERPDTDLPTQLDYAFELCIARRPTDSERQILNDLYHRLHSKSVSPDQPWYGVATALLNLHEVITKD